MNRLDIALLNDFQRGLPLTPRPFAAIAEQLGVTETEVLEALGDLQTNGMISRVGAVVSPRRAGASTLATMSVPNQRLAEVARAVSAYPEVNHNYEREHCFNLWFVLTASDDERLEQVCKDIETRTGLAVMLLPLEQDYHIDLAFPMELP